MGQSHAVHTYIETQSYSFLPGDSITGNIYIQSNCSTQATKLILLLTCYSKSKFNKISNEYSETYEGNTTLFEISYSCYEFEGNLPQGQFAIPFKIQLPTDLKPSFRYSHWLTYGKISYKLRGVFEDKLEVRTHPLVIWILTPKVSDAKIVPISERMPFIIRNCCRYASGVTELSAELNRSVADIEEELDIRVKVLNIHGKYNVTSIICSLIRAIRLKGQNLEEEASEILNEAVFDLAKEVRIPPYLNQDSMKSYNMIIPLKQISDIWKLPSIETELIECMYTVRVSMVFDKVCGFDDYSIHIPIKLRNSELRLHTPIKPHPRYDDIWNPIILSPQKNTLNEMETPINTIKKYKFL